MTIKRALTKDEIRALYAKHAPRWEIMQAWLAKHADSFPNGFTNADVAAGLGVDTYVATVYIQSYLGAQRAPNVPTMFLLKREGRTRGAVWSIGHKIADKRELGNTLFADVQVKVLRAYEPDMKRLAMLNPSAAQAVAEQIDAVVKGALLVLAHSVNGHLAEAGVE